jgi:hypothetical protein
VNWPAIELMVGSIIIGACVNWIVMVAFFRWKKREEVPDELQKEVESLRKHVTLLRVDMARIKGQLNFKTWKQGS